MNNGVKMVIGILLMAAGIYWYIGNIPYFGAELWKSLKMVFEGVFGALLFFTGLLVAWIAWDDYKMNKLLEEEEAEVKEKIKPRAKKEKKKTTARTKSTTRKKTKASKEK